ncbi:MAG: MoaD/ThiS family protein [Pseudomonadota bacterium]
MAATVELKLYATLRRPLPADGKAVPVTPGTTVAGLLADLGIDLSTVKLVFIDGRKKSIDTALYGGERVGVFPPVGGG